jgi:phage gp46-like protein
VSLFGERRANASEVLDSRLRRGWIGNESTPGKEIGSKIWLYEQSRMTRTVLNGIANAARESLQWMVEDGHAKSIDEVTATLSNNPGVRLNVTVTRPNSKVEHRYYDLWENTKLDTESIIVQPDIILDYTEITYRTNLFEVAGRPINPVSVWVRIFSVVGASGPTLPSPSIVTGVGWAKESKITIEIFAPNGKIIGRGGKGGDSGSLGNGLDVSGAGGGGGGRWFGYGGAGYDATSEGDNGSFNGPGGAGGNGSAGAGTNIATQEAGRVGENALELNHPITLINNGLIAGGGGGGGAGDPNSLSDGGDGGDYAENGEAGSGVSGMPGGTAGYAIVTNGYKVDYVVTGTILGDII